MAPEPAQGVARFTREPAERLRLFEKIVNLVLIHAPHARICFNTTPADTVEAVQRWIKP